MTRLQSGVTQCMVFEVSAPAELQKESHWMHRSEATDPWNRVESSPRPATLRRTVDEALDEWALRSLCARLSKLERSVRCLKEVANNGGVILPIDSLYPAPLRVVRTIHCHVRQEDDDCFLACFLDANINASGDSEQDAFEMLKFRIAVTYRNLSENEHRLGSEPARQLGVLREFIQGA